MSCDAPALGRRLGELPAGSEPTEPELLEHLRNCETCARELTQRLRWFSAWDRNEPSSASIARLRLKGAASPRRRPARLAFGYAFAALLGTALASAGGYWWQQLSAPAEPVASTQPPVATPAPGAAEPLPAATPLELAPRPEAPSASPMPSTTNAPPTVAPRPTTSAQVAETWSEAATALRQGDAQRAHKALGELSRSRDAATRDAARLALAELWLSQEQADKARPLLHELAKSGATPLIRRRAKELLQ